MATLTSLIDDVSGHSGPITVSQLLDRASYERHREGLLVWARALKAERRLSVGMDFTLLFENAATVWVQVQEELRWVTHLTPSRLQPILAEYNRLIPAPGELRGCLFMDTVDFDTVEGYRTPGALEALDLTLHLGVRGYTARHLESTSSGIDPVTFVVFAPRKKPTIGPERLSWSGPRAGHVELLPATRQSLGEEVGVVDSPRSQPPMWAPSSPWLLTRLRPAHEG